MKPRTYFFVGLITTVLMLGACGGGAAPAPGGQAAPTEAVKKPVEKPTDKPIEPTAVKPTEPTVQPPVDDKPTPKEIVSLDAGLSDLNSYKATFNMSFEGTKDGQPKTAQFNSVEEVVKQPPAKRLTLTGLDSYQSGGATSKQDVYEVINLGDKQYIQIGDQCLLSTGQEQAALQTAFNPRDFISDLTAEKVLGKETVNGVPATHYRVNDRGQAGLGYAQAKTEAWVADDGKYVVKLIFEATGKDKFFGNGDTDGTVKWTYEVSNINQPIVIAAPKGCGSAEDIPLMPDATGQTSIGGTTTYNTASPLKDVAAFYEKELTAKGWTKDESNNVSNDSMAQLAFTKDKRTVKIVLIGSPDSGRTAVTIMTEKP